MLSGIHIGMTVFYCLWLNIICFRPQRVGVKQGGSSSCKQFRAYIDPTIDVIRMYGQDDWPYDRMLLFMDDIVVFRTLRQAMEQKLSLRKERADEIGMFHPSKCHYLTMHTHDETPIRLDNVVISETVVYVSRSNSIQQQNNTTGGIPHDQ